ncbi:hypothetical protein PRIPAC_73135 [Pristionchus pacificus]|uniref:Uncharacterized protein n=1 Tax=Pristionchus pacificus TaxID=54126 RepID=A0A2A6CFX6_PRIPA|nr:hypothetical protein PRIPAC_73135 [Pristionchus pacificus]|eukprot:PDM76921.1 hypothetical protein PRIPAC_42316 [Pristionchus pacificus]
MADPMPTTKAVGMDLGTTNSCVAYKNGSVIEVVKNRYGNYIMPSVVYFGSSFKEVGEEAQEMRENEPLNTVFHIKRFMGRMANDPEIMKYFPYPFDVLKGNDGEAIIRVTPFDDNGPCESREYSPEQISAYILRYLKTRMRNNSSDLRRTLHAFVQGHYSLCRKCNYGKWISEGSHRRRCPSKIPKIRQMLREFFGNKDLKLNIPPEHAVAHGAAILAESLSEAARGAVKIKDVLPYSLGVDITYGRFSILLKSNTTYPVSHTACYENARENCTELKFQIFEGEKALHKENNRLGVCPIPIPKRKVGENKILVTFSVDEDGILSVHLRDKDTAVERGTKVKTVTRYTKEQVLNMIKDMRFEEEQEQIQRAKFLARSAFADSMAKVRKITGKTDSTKKKTELDNLVKTEDEWINNMENPSNEELIKRASEIDEKLAAIMKKMRIAERTARTDVDIRLYAEKAAFEALYLMPFFNGLQAVTAHKLSPETRLFAKVSYERKLAYLVGTALIECASSDFGREMATERLRSNEFQNIQATWAPLIDHCSLLLRELRMDATCDRLSRLSDLWEASETGQRQARRLREVVQLSIHQVDGKVDRATEELLDWTELYSIEPLQSQVIDRFAIDDQQHASKRIFVKWNETFSAAEEFLDKEIAKNCQVHVIFGNEDDAARFYIRIFDRYCSNRILLNWRGKEYRDCDSSENPSITIGSLNYFSRISKVDRNTTSVVVLHAEQTLAATFVNCFEEESLDRFLSELFVLTTITVHHFHEIEECLKENQDNLTELIQSWPREYQVFDQDTLINKWKHYCMSYGNEARNAFIEHIRKYSEIWIAQRMIKEYEGPPKLIEYVRHNCSRFVRSAIVARIAKLGDAYVIYSERSSDKLALRIRLTRQLNEDFGLLQFLELRHGCEMTPYKIKCGSILHSCFENYERMLIIERCNPFRSDEGNLNSLKMSKPISVPVPEKIDHFDLPFESFPSKVCKYAQGWQDYNYLIIVVCCNMRLLNNSIHHLRAINANVSFCETPLGLLNESSKNRSETVVVCTTSACFEGWKFLPRTREYIKIIIGHHKNDTSSLEDAYDLAKAQEILSISWENPNSLSKMREFQAGRERAIENTTTFGSSASLTEKRMESHSTTDVVNHLLKAKRMLHRKLQHIASTAKTIHALMPPPKLDSSDSPIDIACGGFLKQARQKMEDVSDQLRNVEKILTSHEFALDNTDLCAEELQAISNRYLIDKDELSSFLATIRNEQPVSWSKVRSEVERFNLLQDADRHWEHCFGDTDPRKQVVAINTASATPSTNAHRQMVLPKDYRKWMLQCSDRHLEDCTLYVVDSEENANQLLAVEDASLERFLDCRVLSVKSKDFENNTSTKRVITLLTSVVVESTANNNKCPMFLFPRRCYDRLTRDLFDSGLLIADEYEEIQKQMKQCDTILLPLINRLPRKSEPVEEKIPIEIFLRAESALLEYGSLQWMEWFARRLKYYKYAPEASAFYHRMIAERHFCRFEEALDETTPGRSITNTERMMMDGFVYSTMDSLGRKRL